MSAAKAPILLGLDLGTTRAKVCACVSSGVPLAAASVSYPTVYPAPDRAEQRPEDWIAALTTATRQVAEALGGRSADVVALGLSAHGPAAVFVGADGLPLQERVPTWQDARPVPFGRRLVDEVGAGWVGLGLPLSGFPAHVWCALESNPSLRSARFALGVKDFLIYRLTGRAATDPSSGPAGDAWWMAAFGAFAWPGEKLAEVLPPGAVAGQLRDDMAAVMGLRAGVPVVMGLNDGASAVLATGAVTPGDVVLTLGTNGVARVVVAEPISPLERLSSSLFCWPFVGGRWVAGGLAKAGASALDWFLRTIGVGDSMAAREAVLSEADASPPGSRGVVFLPYLAGRGTPEPDDAAAGAFLNLRLAHGRGDLARAVLEGVAFSLREIVDRLAPGAAAALPVRLTGGGAGSALWRRIVADVMERPVLHGEADSALGAAMMAAAGAGLYSSPAEAARAMAPGDLETVSPDARHAGDYARRYEVYREQRDRLYPARDARVMPG